MFEEYRTKYTMGPAGEYRMQTRQTVIVEYGVRMSDEGRE
jgi:hypothetical protein